MTSVKSEFDKLYNTNERTNVDSTWAELAKYALPVDAGVLTNTLKTPGTSLRGIVFDTTASKSAKKLANFFHSVVVDELFTRFRLSYLVFGTDVQISDASRDWLNEQTSVIKRILERSNLNREIAKMLKQFVTFGNGAMFMGESEKGTGLYFETFHMSRVAWDETKEREIGKLGNKRSISALQASKDFKVNAETVQKNESGQVTVDTLYYVNENPDLDITGNAEKEDRPFLATNYIDNKEVNIEGYYEKPVLTLRYSSGPGEVYGTGPTRDAYPTIRTVDVMARDWLIAVARVLRPPMKTVLNGIIGTLDLGVDSVNIVRNLDAIAPLNLPADLKTAQIAIEQKQVEIQELYDIDKIEFAPRNQQGEMTVPEVAERISQMQKAFSEVSETLTGLLTDIIFNMMRMLIRKGIMQIPTEINDVVAQLRRRLKLDHLEFTDIVQIEFQTILGRSEQMNRITDSQQWLQILMPLGEVKPEVMDNIDPDAIAQDAARILGVPEEYIVDEAKRTQERAERKQAEKEEQQAKIQNLNADTAAKNKTAQGNPNVAGFS
jgi:hypothetical protein